MITDNIIQGIVTPLSTGNGVTCFVVTYKIW